MKDHEKELYCFLRLYSSDMNSARLLIPMIKRQRKNDAKHALLRDLTVTYSRPFSGNRGTLIPKHTLSIKHVPLEHRPLHRKLVDARNQQFAHTDLDFNQPKIIKYLTSTRTHLLMSMRSFQFGELLAELNAIKALIDAVDISLFKQMATMESRI